MTTPVFSLLPMVNKKAWSSANIKTARSGERTGAVLLEKQRLFWVVNRVFSHSINEQTHFSLGLLGSSSESPKWVELNLPLVTSFCAISFKDTARKQVNDTKALPGRQVSITSSR